MIKKLTYKVLKAWLCAYLQISSIRRMGAEKRLPCHFGTPLSDVNQRWDVFAVCMSFLYVAVVEHRD